MPEIKRIGVLTGGGDAPGLNPAIKGLVYRASDYGIDVVGVYDGWRGLLDPLAEALTLDRESVRRWGRDVGANLGSAGTNPFQSRNEEGEPVDRAADVIKDKEDLSPDASHLGGGEAPLRRA